jgi:hypothetical protein
MFNGVLTGGHGVKINKNTINSLSVKKIIYRGKLTELGKTIEI